MEVRALIAQLLEMPMDARVFAVDQFGATHSPVMDVRVADNQMEAILDIEVETDEAEEPQPEPPMQIGPF